MTMIACTINKTAPVIIGDLLISDSVKPGSFVTPVRSEDISTYLDNKLLYHPMRLLQKIYILKPNVCIAFAGNVFHIKQFLEDIDLYCKINDSINASKMNEFLDQHKNDESWPKISFIVLVVDKEDNHFSVGRFIHGNWDTTRSELFDEVFTAGSGSIDFLKETVAKAKIDSAYPSDNINYTLQINIALIAKLLSHERLTLDSIKQLWGAGFEMIYFDGNQFVKLDDITYVINQGQFDESGNIPNVPVPGVVLNYKYSSEVLKITAIWPSKGRTKETDNNYIIETQDFGALEFLVTPVNTSEPTILDKEPSFISNRVAMGYIIETRNGYYLPSSFNTGPEIEVKYDYPNSLTITMQKEISDILVSHAKSTYPNLD